MLTTVNGIGVGDKVQRESKTGVLKVTRVSPNGKHVIAFTTDGVGHYLQADKLRKV